MSSRNVNGDWKDIAASFGGKVRYHREALGLNQEQLAERAGISRNQIQNIENSRNNQLGADGRKGPGNPRMDTVFALANALHVEIGYLVDPRQSPAPSRPTTRAE